MAIRTFLGSGDTYTTATNNTTIYGASGTGTEKLLIQSGVTGVTTDANIERIDVAGNLADYKFVVISGTGIQVQNTAGTVIGTIPSLNQATTLAFANGSASLVQTGSTTVTLGGQAISTTTATPSAFTTTALGTSFNTTVTSGVTTTTPTTSATVGFSSATASLTEGNSGTANMTFTVTLSQAQTGTTTVNYTTANGTATAGSDYTAASGILTFAANETSKTVTVAVTGDTLYEANETFTVTLSGPSTGVVLGTSVATATITNDDTNLSPVNAVPTSFNAVAGQVIAVPGFSVSDGDNSILTVKLEAANSIIKIDAATPSSTVTGNSSAAVTLSGSVSQINADLALLKYTSGLSTAGTQSMTVTTTDPNAATDVDSIAINVSAPQLLTTANETLTGGTGDDSFTESSTNTTNDVGASDSITGGTGTDTLIIIAGGATPVPASRISGVEIYDIDAGAQAGAIGIDATGNSDFKQVTLRDGDSTSNQFTVTGFGTTDTLSIPNALGGTTTSVTINGLGASDTATATLGTGVNLGTLTFGSAFNTLTVNTGASGTNTISTLTLTSAFLPTNITAVGTAGLVISNALTGLDFGTITGGSGNDSFSIAGNSTTTGAVMNGGAGNDTITGGTLVDTITGGTGADSMTGGTGNDTFIFVQGDSGMTSATRDTFGDLNAGDIINLSSTTFTNLTIPDGVIGTNAGTKATNGTVEVYTDTTNGFLVVETSDTGTAVTYEQFVLPSAFKNAPMTSASELLTVGTPSFTATNDNAGLLTLTGQAIGAAAAIVVNLSTPPTVNTVAQGVNAVTSVNAAAVTGFGINISTNASATAGTYTGSTLADTIIGSTGADTITVGSGVDTVIFTTALSKDTVSDFSSSGTDKVNFDLSDLNGATGLKSGQATVLGGGTSVAAANTDTVTFLAIASGDATQTALTVANALNLTVGTYADIAAVEAFLEGADGIKSSAGTGMTQWDSIALQWIGTDGKYHIGAVYFDSAVAANTDIAAADISIVEIATLGTAAVVNTDWVFVS